MFAEVKSFCCCASLAVGAKIVGFSCTILAAITTIMYSVPAIRLMYYLPVTTLVFYELMALTSAVQFITGVLLIIGAYRKNTKLMRPWAIVSWWQSVSLVVVTIVGSFVYVMASVQDEVEDDTETTIVVVAYTTYALMIYYAASVVDSYCTEISTGRSRAREETLIEDAADSKDDMI